jgi:enterochelin esterase-like enzyme
MRKPSITPRLAALALILAVGALLAGCAAELAAEPTSPNPDFSPSAVPTALVSATPAPACAETRGRFEEHSLDTGLLYRPLIFRVYLPPCYDAQREPGYPLLILLHGQGFDAGQWDRLGADEAVEALMAAGESGGMLLVFPFEQYDLLPPQQTKYNEAIAGPLLDWLRANFAVCPVRDCTGIGGVSRGGGWAVRIGFEAWQTFSAVGAHSLPPFPDEVSRLERQLKAIGPGQVPRLYLDVGRKDIWRDAAIAFHDFLTVQDVPHAWLLNEGSHDEAYWTAHTAEYIAWYSAALSEKP